MVKWLNKTQQEMQERIVQLGLGSCPVCGSTEALVVGRLPTFLLIGGISPARDSDNNALFMLHVECTTCGYVMLFNSERFSGSDVGTLWAGPDPEPTKD